LAERPAVVVQSNGGADKKKKLLRRRSGLGQDIASVYHNYPPGTKPDNLAPYKVGRIWNKTLFVSKGVQYVFPDFHHDAFMHHGENRGSKNVNLAKRT